MKKSPKRLELAKETIRTLEKSDLRPAVGGVVTFDCDPTSTNNRCRNATCHEC